MKSLFALGLFWLFTLVQPSNHTVNITINNIKEPSGKLRIAVYKGKENYQENAMIDTSFVVENEKSKKIKLRLPQGEYAIGVFHDLNDNEELDKNFMGIPTEGFGFSNKSMGTFGPPSYEDTKFNVDKNATSVEVNLKHL